MTSEEKLQRELSDVRAELAEIRRRANTPFALVNDDRYWDLCISERHLVRVLGEKHQQLARPQRSIASTRSLLDARDLASAGMTRLRRRRRFTPTPYPASPESTTVQDQ